MTLQPSPSLPLADVFEGQIVGPGDLEYEQARMPLAGGFDPHPIAIYRPANVADVARVVRYAAERGLDLAVRCGGHSALAHCVCDGIIVDLSKFREIDIDTESRTVWAGAGLRAGELADALAPHKLAVPFGDTASVGIGGISLAGGSGFLTRKFGLTIDSVLGVEIVTADGELIHADETSHPDLFWAVRGGGGNFGIVTRLHSPLRDVPEAFGGMLLLPATPQVLAGFVEAARNAPDELSTIVNVMPAPPAPFIPEAARGKTIVLAQLLYAGDVASGERAMAPFRALATPLADMLRPVAYGDMLAREEGPGFRPIVVTNTGFADRIDEAAAARIVEAIDRSDAMLRVVQLRPLGGQFARIPADSTAFAHRDAGIFVQTVSTTDGTPEDRERRIGWTSDLVDALCRPGPAYVVATMASSADRLREAYGASTWDRLVEVKRRYDPANVFHVNYNVPPDAD